MTSRGKADEFAVCVQSDEDNVDLIVGKIYRVVKPKRHDRPTDVRLIDESAEDYLYPRRWFVSVELPLKVRKALVRVRGKYALPHTHASEIGARHARATSTTGYPAPTARPIERAIRNEDRRLAVSRLTSP